MDLAIHGVEVSGDLIEDSDGEMRTAIDDPRGSWRVRDYTSNGEPTLPQDQEIQREILPIPDRPYTGLVTYDAKDPETSFPPIKPLRPPEGAPNVLVVLLDDVGFAASSAFGGPCSTPTAERLAAGGLKYNRFHISGRSRSPRTGAAPATARSCTGPPG